MHVSTAPVARDIVEIFERHGQWREDEAKRLLASLEGLLSPNSRKNKADILQRTAYKPGQEMLQYWGFVSPATSPPLSSA